MGYQYGGCSKFYLNFAQKIQNLRLDSHIPVSYTHLISELKGGNDYDQTK